MYIYIWVISVSFLIALIFIYGVGAIWAACLFLFWGDHFDEFSVLTIEGHILLNISFLFSFLIAWFIAKKKEWCYLTSECINSEKMLRSAEGSLVIGISVILSFFLTYQLDYATIDTGSILLKNASSSIPQFAAIGVLSNIMITLGEEMVYRGIIFVYLLRRTNQLHVSVIISSMVFSVMHFQYTEPISFLLAFIAGCLFAYAYFYGKSLLIPVGMHFSYNFFMEIFKSEEREYLTKILDVDYAYMNGVGEVFAIFRFVFLLGAAGYLYSRFLKK